MNHRSTSQHATARSTTVVALLAAVPLSAIAALSGCNTAKGAATDLSKAGESIAETTREIGNTLSGENND